ncbi:MAG: SH3 domain-containing protein [Alistipes sp.]|nr:SH3 domain-containing protein [Alistipes sp.]
MKKLFAILVVACAALMVSCGSNSDSVKEKAIYFAEKMAAAEMSGSEAQVEMVDELIDRYLDGLTVDEELLFMDIYVDTCEDILDKAIDKLYDDAEAQVKEAEAKVEELIKVYSNCYDGYLNLRAQPSTNSEIVCKMSNGPEGAELLSDEGKWSLVRINGIEGYAWSAYLQTTPTDPVYISAAEVVGNWMGDESGTLTVNKNGKFTHQFGASATMGIVENGSWRLSHNKLVLVYADGEVVACTVSGKKMNADDGETFTRL